MRNRSPRTWAALVRSRRPLAGAERRDPPLLVAPRKTSLVTWAEAGSLRSGEEAGGGEGEPLLQPPPPASPKAPSPAGSDLRQHGE